MENGFEYPKLGAGYSEFDGYFVRKVLKGLKNPAQRLHGIINRYIPTDLTHPLSLFQLKTLYTKYLCTNILNFINSVNHFLDFCGFGLEILHFLAGFKSYSSEKVERRKRLFNTLTGHEESSYMQIEPLPRPSQSTSFRM